MLRTIGNCLLCIESERYNARLVSKRECVSARDERIISVVSTPITEIGNSCSESSLPKSCCIKVGIECLLRVECRILNGIEPKDVGVDIPIVTSPVCTKFASLVSECSKRE